MYEVRWHGRGGQGAVTAAKVLAQAALVEDKYVQAFPEYGAERMGAPVRSFTRIEQSPIYVRDQVRDPDAVVILDDTLLYPEIIEGLKKGGIALVNTAENMSWVKDKLGAKDIKVHVVNATRICLDVLGRNVPSTTMVGALVAVTDCVKLDSLLKSFKEEFSSKFTKDIIKKNLEAMKVAFDEAKKGCK